MRFRVHLRAELPPNGPYDQGRPLPQELITLMDTWQERVGFLKQPQQRQAWLSCIRKYIFTDSDGDGVADWTAVVDGRPSRILLPLDPDLDGDGLENLRDPDPYHGSAPARPPPFPTHLQLTGLEGEWQRRLWQDFGVVAIDHTDQNSSAVLKVFFAVLKLESFGHWRQRSKLFDRIYAFVSHRPGEKIAAYHPELRAISVPGRQSYIGEELKRGEERHLMAAVLHELGHALMWGTVSAPELVDQAHQLAKWRVTPSLALSDPQLLTPFRGPALRFVSAYARTNVHEWFAESFAAYIWDQENLDAKYGRAFPRGQLSVSLKSWIKQLLERVR